MSNQAGRSWYRFSSVVRQTQHSSRDPSPPRHVIKPPPSPPSPPPPPQPLSTPLRPPPKEVQEAKPSPVRSIKHEPAKQPRHEEDVTHQKSILSEKANLVHDPNKQQHEVQEAKPSPVTSSRSIKHEPPKPKHEEDVTHQKSLRSEKTNLVDSPNKEQEHESDDVVMDTQGLITISGENKGAVMEIKRSPINKSKKHNDKIGGNLPMDGYVNSNVQIVNGSVVYNSTETHHDPGVHLNLYWKPSSGNGFIVKDHGNGYNSSIN